MSYWKIIKGLKLKYIRIILVLFLKNPIFAFATIRATSATYRISQKKFPDIHSKENKANAFRHSLWSILMAKKCFSYSKNLEFSLNWTKKFTDLHEKLSPNKELSRKMDLKNNQLGREWFLDLNNSNENEIIDFLLIKTNKAKKVKNISEIENSKNLVFLED